MNLRERLMGWMKPKPVPYDPVLEHARHRLAELEAEAARRKALSIRVAARRRPAR
jgi:hypothetical protein